MAAPPLPPFSDMSGFRSGGSSPFQPARSSTASWAVHSRQASAAVRPSGAVGRVQLELGARPVTAVARFVEGQAPPARLGCAVAGSIVPAHSLRCERPQRPDAVAPVGRTGVVRPGVGRGPVRHRGERRDQGAPLRESARVRTGRSYRRGTLHGRGVRSPPSRATWGLSVGSRPPPESRGPRASGPPRSWTPAAPRMTGRRGSGTPQ